VETRRLRIGDIEISCDVAGQGEAALVLVHGLTGHRADFSSVLPALEDTGRLFAPDVRGHGDAERTGRAEGHDFDVLVADLAAIVDALGLERFDLLGHSFGGMISLRFLLAHPERVASFIAMDTAPFAPDAYGVEGFEKGGAIAREAGMAKLQEIVERVGRDRQVESPSGRQQAKWDEAYWEHHRMRYGAMDPHAYTPLGLTMVEQESIVDRLGEIACPTTVIVGSEDDEFLAGADALSEGIPGARRVTLPDAGHHPHMENRAGWLAAVRDHLAWARGHAAPAEMREEPFA